MNKKLLVLSVVVVVCIFAFPFLIGNINNDDMTLVESMKDTKKDRQKIEQLLEKVSKEFHNKYDGKASVGFSFDKRTVSVQLQSQEIEDKHDGNMKAFIYDIADDVELDDISVKFRVMSHNVMDVSEEDKAMQELAEEVLQIAEKILKEEDFEIGGLLISPRKPKLYVEISLPFSDEHNEDTVDSVEERIKNAVLSKANVRIDIAIKKKSKSQVMDKKWAPIFRSIREETKKKFDEYRGFAYSFHPKPLQIIIKTDLHESKWWRNTDKKVEEIIEYVEAIIDIKREELAVKKIPLDIIVRGENNKQLN